MFAKVDASGAGANSQKTRGSADFSARLCRTSAPRVGARTASAWTCESRPPCSVMEKADTPGYSWPSFRDERPPADRRYRCPYPI